MGADMPAPFPFVWLTFFSVADPGPDLDPDSVPDPAPDPDPDIRNYILGPKHNWHIVDLFDMTRIYLDSNIPSYI